MNTLTAELRVHLTKSGTVICRDEFGLNVALPLDVHNALYKNSARIDAMFEEFKEKDGDVDFSLQLGENHIAHMRTPYWLLHISCHKHLLSLSLKDWQILSNVLCGEFTACDVISDVVSDDREMALCVVCNPIYR